MIDPNKLRILSNYVLVKPDKAFETYQFSGKETGILAATYKYDEKGVKVSTEMEHVSISGTVYAVPNELKFYGDKIWDLQDNNDFRPGTFVRQKHIQSQIDRYRQNSVQFNTPMEVQVGDKVYFEYLAYQISEQIITSEGIMFLLKYDMLILAQRKEEIKMLNGFILVENEAIEAEELEKGIAGTTTSTGIVLLQAKSEKKIRNRAQGKVVSANAPCASYLDFRGHYDGEVKQGDIIVYDPRFARELEYGLHRIFSEKKLVRIQRKDVYAVLKETDFNISYL